MRIDRIKLIVLMAERDMTIGRLAELSRLSVSTICQVKAGKSRVIVAILSTIAFFGFILWLFTL